MSLSKKVMISGASGLVGSALSEALQALGHEVRTLSRSHGDVIWDVSTGDLPGDALEGIDVIIHLAGEPIAQRWTDSVKKRILDSRVQSTKILAEAAAKEAKSPVLIVASGVNYYGDQRADSVDENSAHGNSFLSNVCQQGEDAAAPLQAVGGRVVYIRTGVVLNAEGGALAKMLPPFRLGLGGRVGSGTQRMSWVSLPDLVAIYCYAMNQDGVTGPINAVAPEPVTNNYFTKTLSDVLGKPAIVPVPAFAIKAMFGEMGKATVLGDLAVTPKRLVDLGFTWKHAKLEAALSATLKHENKDS
jgi:uncharacterized protein (TIGR01777 family)